MKFILRKMKKKTNRSATFVSSLSLKYPKGKMISATGKIRGSISYRIIGNKGFGYDSIFIPHSKDITFGQMPKLQKIRIRQKKLFFSKKTS